MTAGALRAPTSVGRVQDVQGADKKFAPPQQEAVAGCQQGDSRSSRDYQYVTSSSSRVCVL